MRCGRQAEARRILTLTGILQGGSSVSASATESSATGTAPGSCVHNPYLYERALTCLQDPIPGTRRRGRNCSGLPCCIGGSVPITLEMEIGIKTSTHSCDSL